MTRFSSPTTRIARFLRSQTAAGRGMESEITRLSGDASARQYYRCRSPRGESLILALYPEPIQPESFPYGQVHKLFSQIGLPVPATLAVAPELGIVAQQDLGDESLLSRLAIAHPDEKRRWLSRAVDYIVTIQSRGTSALDPDQEASTLAFDTEKLLSELRFFEEHFVRGYRRRSIPEVERLTAEFRALAEELAGLPRTLCHRDYQVRNLMVNKETLYIIDFQDARRGPRIYDLVSLLKDSIELEPPEVEFYTRYFLERLAGPGPDRDFPRQFHLMSVQRLLKALGTFGYQIGRRGNPVYQRFVGGSLRGARASLHEIREFPYIQTLLEKEIRDWRG